MPSTNPVGIAPLLGGLLLTSQSARQLVQSGSSPWVGITLVGGCAAILVGLGSLLGIGGFGAASNGVGLPATILTALALLSFGVGAALVLL